MATTLSTHEGRIAALEQVFNISLTPQHQVDAVSLAADLCRDHDEQVKRAEREAKTKAMQSYSGAEQVD